MVTLHIVPHTHWDREWYLPFQTMRIKLVHLMDGLLRLLAESPRYRHFTLDGQTIVVDDYLRVRPERRGEIVGHVATGRLLVGPWTILPDEFLVSPESLVRNLALGARTAEELGGRMDVGYVPDPFGHVGQLPQILRGFGIDSAALRRGLSEEPCELWWEAPDGSRVLLAYLREGYDNAARLPEEPEAFASVVRRRAERLAQHSSVSHRLLLNGTDHHEPQPLLATLLESTPTGDDRWLLSTLPAYLRAVREEIEAGGVELPVVRGELRSPARHHLLPGVLSSRVWIKQRNDRCEQALETWAEPFVAWAERLCAGRPDTAVWTGQVETPRVGGATALLEEAWRILLTCHPHDSICGCSVDQVHEEMRSRFDQVEQIADELTRQSLVALAEEVDTRALERRGARQALVVFQPAAGGGAGLARATLELGAGLEAFEVIDAAGVVRSHRVVSREIRDLANLEFAPDDIRPLIRGVEDGRVLGLAVQEVVTERDGTVVRVDLVLCERGEPDLQSVEAGLRSLEAAMEADVSTVRLRARFATRVDLDVALSGLPPHGYRTLGLRPARSSVHASRVDEGTRISSDLLEAEAADDGTVTLRHLRTGASLAGLLRLRDQADRGDSYNFCPVDGDEPVEKPTCVRIRREESELARRLEIQEVFRVPRRLGRDRTRRSGEIVDLPVRISISLVDGFERADVDVFLDNTAEDHRLQVLFPLGGPVDEGLYDGHYEIVRRTTEVPEGGDDWQESPMAEHPMRAFVAARPRGIQGGPGLLVAAHGLREASVSPEGVIAVTLLRSFGWLSRDDLATRRGPAGPLVPTPGGQSLGPHSFSLSLVPFEGPIEAAVAQADAFRAAPRGVGTGIHPGPLPPEASLLRLHPACFRLTAVCGEPDGSMVVRGVHLGEGAATVSITPLRRPRSAERIRLDGTPLGPIEPERDGTLRIHARPREIVSVRLRHGE